MLVRSLIGDRQRPSVASKLVLCSGVVGAIFFFFLIERQTDRHVIHAVATEVQ